MKRALIFSVLIGTMFGGCAQQPQAEQASAPLTKEDYLQKNKRQKTAAIVLVSAGGALVIIGAAVSASTTDYSGYLWGSGQTTQDNSDETFAEILAITGIAAIVGSIPLFVSAHKNKLKALSMSFRNQPAPAIQHSMVIYRPVPSISLQLRL